MSLTEPLTLDAWDALPETDESRRAECVDGVLVVLPPPQVRHQLALFSLWHSLRSALPAELIVTADPAVLIREQPLTTRVPDLAVLMGVRDLARHLVQPAEVRLAIEIVSPTSGRTDRVDKLREYAEAGIADYWIIDLDAPSVTCFRLGEAGRYEQVATHTGASVARACDLAVPLDVDRLTDP